MGNILAVDSLIQPDIYTWLSPILMWNVEFELKPHDDDDDDDDNDDEKLFLWNGWPKKGVYLYFRTGPLSEILTTTNLGHTASRIWTRGEP